MRAVTNRLPRYGVAVFTTASASLLALFLSPLSLRVPFALFAAAVLISSLEGGLKPGLLATALSTAALAVEFWLFPLVPLPENHGELVPLLVLFVIVGLLSNYVGEQCWRAVQAAEQVRATPANCGDGSKFTVAEKPRRLGNPLEQPLTGSNGEEPADRFLEPVYRSADAESGQAVAHPIARFLGRDGDPIVAEPRENGAVLAMDAEPEPSRDSNGCVLGTMLLVRERRTAQQPERELRQQEEQFRSLAACAPAGILQMDPECRCVYTNCSCQLIGGFSAEEGHGDGWARFLHPEDRARVVPDWLAAMQSGKEFACELRFQRPQPHGQGNGSVSPSAKGPSLLSADRWVRLRSSPMYSDLGKRIGHVAILHEMDDHKLAEETLRETRMLLSAVVEEAAGALFVKDQEGRCLLTNAAGAHLIGKSIDEIIGTQESQLLVEAAGRHDYVARKMPLRDECGNVLGLITVYREVMEEERLRAELVRAQAALEIEVEARQRAEEALRQCQARQECGTEQAVDLVQDPRRCRPSL